MPPLSATRRWVGRRDGRDGFDVTVLGFGAATISNHHDAIQMTESAAIDACFAAYESGVRYFDTAPWYGRTRSERRLGLALNNYERSSFRLQTKVGRFLVPGQANDQDSHGGAIVNEAGGYPDSGHTAPGSRYGVTHDYSYPAIMRQHEDSLQRLGVSHVDSLVIHDLDLGYGSRPQIEGYLGELSPDGGGGARALRDLRAAGRVQAVGSGCNVFGAPQHCDEFAKRVAELVDLDFFLIAGAHYTLLDQQALDVQFPIIEERNMVAIVGTPLASGRLAGGNFYGKKDESPTMLKVGEIEAVCQRFDVDIKAAALQFPLAHPRVSSIIPGSASAAEAAENKALLDTPIPKGLWRALKEGGLLRGDAPVPGDSSGNL